VYWQYITGCDRQTYGRMETEARLRGLGVWGVSGGLTQPWDYRSNKRKPSSSSSAPASGRYTCKKIGSYAQAQVLLRQGHEASLSLLLFLNTLKKEPLHPMFLLAHQI